MLKRVVFVIPKGKVIDMEKGFEQDVTHVPDEWLERARIDFVEKTETFKAEMAKTTTLIRPGKKESKPTGVAWLFFRARKHHPDLYVSFTQLGTVFGMNINKTREAYTLRARIGKAKALLEERGWIVSNLPDQGYRLTLKNHYAEVEMLKTLSRARMFITRFNSQYKTNTLYEREMSPEIHRMQAEMERFEIKMSSLTESLTLAPDTADPPPISKQELQIKPVEEETDPNQFERKMLESEELGL